MEELDEEGVEARGMKELRVDAREQEVCKSGMKKAAILEALCGDEDEEDEEEDEFEDWEEEEEIELDEEEL